MKEHKLGIIMNGVTGRMGTNQHLIRSICAIRDQGGVHISPDEKITVDPILTGRNEDKLKVLAENNGVSRWTTNLDEALADAGNQIFFDASSTLHRVRFVEMAAKAGKAVYCEKPMIQKFEEGHESALFEQEMKLGFFQFSPEGLCFQFCKTAYKPYDIAVTACLVAGKEIFGEENFKI